MTNQSTLGDILLAVVARATPYHRLGFALLGLTALAVTWNGVVVFGRKPVDWPMLAAFAVVAAYVGAARPAVPLPLWLLAGGAALAMSALIAVVWVPAPSLTSPFHGQAQGATAALAHTPRSNLGNLARLENVFVVMPIVVALAATTHRRCSMLADLWALSAIISAAVALGDLVGVTHIGPGLSLLAAQSRGEGLTGHPNELGLSCTLVLPVVTIWLLRSPPWKLVAILALGVLLAGVYVSGSRAAAVAAPFAIAATIAAVPRLRRHVPHIGPVAGMILVGVVMFSNLPEQIDRQARLDSSVPGVFQSDQARTIVGDQALRAFEARPIAGVGFEVVSDAHDVYLALLASGGLITLIGLTVYGAGVVGVVRRARRGPGADLAVSLAVSLSVMLGSSIVGTQVGERYPFFSLGILLALALLTEPGQSTVRADVIRPQLLDRVGRARHYSGVPSSPQAPATIADGHVEGQATERILSR